MQEIEIKHEEAILGKWLLDRLVNGEPRFSVSEYIAYAKANGIGYRSARRLMLYIVKQGVAMRHTAASHSFVLLTGTVAQLKSALANYAVLRGNRRLSELPR